MRLHKVLSSGGMILVATFLLFLCFRQVDFSVFWRELLQMNPYYPFLALIILTAILWLKAIQWKFFLPVNSAISLTTVFEVIAIMIMMANTLPWGQTFAIYHLGTRLKTGKTIALSVMTLDQVATGFAKLTVFLLTAFLTPLPVWMKRGTILTIVSVIGSYLILLYLSYRHQDFREMHSPSSHKMWHRIAHHVSKWAHHLHTLRDYKKIFWAVFLALVVKLCEVSAIYFVQKGFGLSLPWWSALFVIAGLNLATSVPVVPGNLGVYEATAFFIYRHLGIEPSQAMSLALFQHLMYLLPLVLPGYWITMKMGIRSEKLREQNLL